MILCLTLLTALSLLAAAPADLRTEAWEARWISVPGTGPQDYGV